MKLAFKFGFASKKKILSEAIQDYEHPNFKTLDKRPNLGNANNVSASASKNLQSSSEHFSQTLSVFAANVPPEMTAATTNENSIKQIESSKTSRTNRERPEKDLDYKNYLQNTQESTKVSTGQRLKAAVSSYAESARKTFSKYKIRSEPAATIPENFSFGNFAKSQVSADFLAGNYGGETAGAQSEGEHASAACAQTPDTRRAKSSSGCKKGPYTRKRKTRTTHKMRILAAKRRHAKRRTTRSGKVLSRVPKNLEAWEDIKQNVRKPEDNGYDLKFDYNKILKPSFVEDWLNDTVHPLVTALPLSAAQLGDGQIKYAVDVEQGLDEDANRECAHCKRDPTGASGLGNCDTCYYFLKSERTEFLKYGDDKNYKREFDAHASCPFMSADVEDSFASTGDSMLGICLMPILGTWEKMDRKIFRAKTRFRQFKEHVPVWSQKVRTAANNGYGLRSFQPTKCGPQPKTWGELLPQDFSPRYDKFWPKDFGPTDYYKVSPALLRPAVPKVVSETKSSPATKKTHYFADTEIKNGFKAKEYSSGAEAVASKVTLEIPKPKSVFVFPTTPAEINVHAEFNAPVEIIAPVENNSPAKGDVPASNKVSIEADLTIKTNISQEERASFKNSGFNFFSGADATENPNDEWASAEKAVEVDISAIFAQATTILSEHPPLKPSSISISPVVRATKSPGTDSTDSSLKDIELKVHVSTTEEADIPELKETRPNLVEFDGDEGLDQQYQVDTYISDDISVLVCMVPDEEKCIDSSSDENRTIDGSEIPQTLKIFASEECQKFAPGPMSTFTERVSFAVDPTPKSKSPSLDSNVSEFEKPASNTRFTSKKHDSRSERPVQTNEDVIHEIDEMLKGLGYTSVGSSLYSETSQDYIKTFPLAELDSGSSATLNAPEFCEMEQIQESSCPGSEDDVVEEVYTKQPGNTGNPHRMENLTEALIAEIIDQYNEGKYDQPGNPNAAAEILGALLDEVFMGVQGFSEEFIESCKKENPVSQENYNVTSDQDDAHRFTVVSDSEDDSSVSDVKVPSKDSKYLAVSSKFTETDEPALKELKLVKRTSALEKNDTELEVFNEKELNFETQSLEDIQSVLKPLKLVSRFSITSPVVVPLKALGAVVEPQPKVIKSFPSLTPVICVSKSTPKTFGEIENVKSLSSVFNENLSVSHFQNTLKQQKLLPTVEGTFLVSETKPLNEVSPVINSEMKTVLDSFKHHEEPVVTNSATNEPLWIALSMDKNFDRNVTSESNNNEELDFVRIAKENMPRMVELFQFFIAHDDNGCIDLGIKKQAKVHFDRARPEIQEYDQTFSPSEISRFSEASKVPSKGLLKITNINTTEKSFLVKKFIQTCTEVELKETEDDLWEKIGECQEISSKPQQVTDVLELHDSFILFLESFKISGEKFAEVAKCQILEYTKWLAHVKGSTSSALALVNGAGNRYTILLGFIDQAKMTKRSIDRVDAYIRDIFESLAIIRDILDQIQEAILQLRFEFPDYVGTMARISEISAISSDKLLQAYSKFCLNNVKGPSDLASIHYCTGYEVFLEKTSYLAKNPRTDYEMKFATFLNNLQSSHDAVKVATTELEKRLQIILMSTAQYLFDSENTNLVQKRLLQATIVSKKSIRSNFSLSGQNLTSSKEDDSDFPTEVKTEIKKTKKMSMPGWMKFKGLGKKESMK